jgi:hypothetical protein
MLTLVIALASYSREDYVTKHICTLGGVVVAIAAISVGAYCGAINNDEISFIGILFVFVCGSLAGQFSQLVLASSFVAASIYNIPVTIGFVFYHYYRIWRRIARARITCEKILYSSIRRQIKA